MTISGLNGIITRLTLESMVKVLPVCKNIGLTIFEPLAIAVSKRVSY